jgi:hypothetical protein
MNNLQHAYDANLRQPPQHQARKNMHDNKNRTRHPPGREDLAPMPGFAQLQDCCSCRGSEMQSAGLNQPHAWCTYCKTDPSQSARRLSSDCLLGVRCFCTLSSHTTRCDQMVTLPVQSNAHFIKTAAEEQCRLIAKTSH